jgi:excisionase family DNA binding protein
VDTERLLAEIARGNVIALVATPPAAAEAATPVKRWYSMAEVAEVLGFGLGKVKMLVITRELRSVKVGKYRRILPEWVDEYVASRVEEVA